MSMSARQRQTAANILANAPVTGKRSRHGRYNQTNTREQTGYHPAPHKDGEGTTQSTEKVVDDGPRPDPYNVGAVFDYTVRLRHNKNASKQRGGGDERLNAVTRFYKIFVKQWLIESSVERIRARKNSAEVSVVDLAGGKGGDIVRLLRAGVSDVILVDVSEESVREAKRSAEEFINRPPARRPGGAESARLRFYAYDGFGPLFDEQVMSPLRGTVDLVSCQFGLHFAACTKASLSDTLGRVSRWISPGGYLVGTVPDSDSIRTRITALRTKALGGNAPAEDPLTADPSLGRELFQLSLDPQYEDARLTRKDSGANEIGSGYPYLFRMGHSIPMVREYLIDRRELTDYAQFHGLQLVEIVNLGQLYEALAQEERPGLPSLPKGSEDRYHASMYLYFVFQKVGVKNPTRPVRGV
jgi:SAM-dependent methyltransferase